MKFSRLDRWMLAAILVLSAGVGACGKSTTTPTPAASKTRIYYIAADEVRWDYAPSGMNLITGQPFGDVENTFVENGPDRIGREYLKALYREYTDNSFTVLKARTAAWQHLGALGPLVRAAVGDSVLIVFKNNTRIPATIHMHGLQYEKSSEGAPYADSTSGDDVEDDAVQPGATRTYRYFVPERSGPGPADGSSVMWMYHSHVDEVQDTYTGLIGAAIVTAKGMARDDGSPKDVDRELVALFHVYNENASAFIDDNIQHYAGDPGSVDPDDEDFNESNLMHAINGYVYGNLPGLDMHRGQMVRWYLMAMGTEVDLHTPHWHGNTTLLNGGQVDVTELLPGSMKMGDMHADAAGTWLFHCHVNDHITAGMQALYTVLP